MRSSFIDLHRCSRVAFSFYPVIEDVDDSLHSFRNPVLYENKKLNTSAKSLIWKVGQATKSNLM